ncbi:MAG: DUF1553 domain-containing protein, partial [Planctomycetales bacterium]|nr:DUF1553 domain-containing protein [Planctomycetales bacterium]
LAKLVERELTPSPDADRATLIRRLYYDLIGLPPSRQEIEQFVTNGSPHAYEDLVERLLASPEYGNRWARHWLDVVHYGDTHGYDKDKLRPNAWPYRDYVIRSWNADKPYGRFVREQIAGDVLWPETRDGIEATGFISAGPWDFIGHAEVPETKYDGQVARNLDRDDMVSSTMNTFQSMTIQCARCHNHKFDPVTQEHYYSLQAVFAALDRADRNYDVDPEIAHQRRQLAAEKAELERQQSEIDSRVQQLAGEPLKQLQDQIADLETRSSENQRPQFGYHSEISADPDVPKWVQIDLGDAFPVDEIVVVGCHDDFNGIGDGFGFPTRFKIELSDDPTFETGATTIADHTAEDFENPGVRPLRYAVGGQAGRYVRVTATRLALRQNDYIFALGELVVRSADGSNLARSANVTSLDSIEAPVRWQRQNLVDGYAYGMAADDQLQQELESRRGQRDALVASTLGSEGRQKLSQIEQRLAEVTGALEQLPPQQVVYAGTVHSGSGAFIGRGHLGGKPREIHLLLRGDLKSPAQLVQPGAVPSIAGCDWKFDLPAGHVESDRRIALADWLTRDDNPLTWRSMVNRVWQYHFGRGIVESANDFGRMGDEPSHPALLDWLATRLRDEGQSLKDLHRLIVQSSVYRQVSADRAECAEEDAANTLLWRMNRRALDAESIRDTVLAVSGQLDHRMYGAGFQDFVLERPEHSPHYEYQKHDPADLDSHRRAVYRFLVRSQQQPFMQTLDCADPSQSVDRRGTTLTAVQALTLMNNNFMVYMSDKFASDLAQQHAELLEQVEAGFWRTTGRAPSADEAQALQQFAKQYGMANVCRVLLNLNEFVFVD